jgi:dual specificity phosphatase 3
VASAGSPCHGVGDLEPRGRVSREGVAGEGAEVARQRFVRNVLLVARVQVVGQAVDADEPHRFDVHLFDGLCHAAHGGPPLRMKSRCQIRDGSCVEGGMNNDSNTQPLPVLRVANAHFVTPFLAVGGDLAYDDTFAVRQSVELVVDGGVTHILDVRQEADDADWWASVEGLSYLWAGIDDAGQRLPAAWFDRITGWATEAIAAGGVVLTHCHMGINRGPSAGYAVLLALGWDPVDALAAIRAARPIANTWYAEDALAWHLDRVGASAAERHTTYARVARWREENPLDVVRIIRRIRAEEAS